MDYYENYQLDVSIWELTPDDKYLLNACIYLVDNADTIRGTCKNFDFKKSTLHKYIHTKVRRLSFELYSCVVKQLRKKNRNY